MTATREAIRPDSPAHEGRQRFHNVNRKVPTIWAPVYAAVDFDHEARPVKVNISQPGKLLNQDISPVIDGISRCITAALNAWEGHAIEVVEYELSRADRGQDDLPPKMKATITVTAPRNHDREIQRVVIAWAEAGGNDGIQLMLEGIGAAVTATIQEARGA